VNPRAEPATEGRRQHGVPKSDRRGIFQDEPEDRVVIELSGVQIELFDCAIEPDNYETTGHLRIRVSAGSAVAVFEVVFSPDKAEFKQVSGPTAYGIVRGKRRTLAEFFNEDPPIIHFVNGDFLVFHELFELPKGTARVSFDTKKIATWNWKGVNLKKETQGPEKDKSSIQRRVIERILAGEFGKWDVVFDGDGKGEVADVVALRRTEDKITVGLWHCKYSGGDEPGARIGDFYEVCGQAQKSVHWRESPRRMLRHLLHQEDTRTKAGSSSRIERGTRDDIQRIVYGIRQVSFEYQVFIVQPGLSKDKITPAFLDVLGATEVFLQETYSMPLRVVASA
jgi:hypothetical protein